MKFALVTALTFFQLLTYPIFCKEVDWGIEVKAKWQQTQETIRVGSELHAKAKFKNDETWADVEVKFSHVTPDCISEYLDLYLQKALIGYSPIFDEDNGLFFQIGRCPLDGIFRSYLQHNCMFNGMHISYAKDNFLIHCANFTTNFQGDQLGLIGEGQYNLSKIPLTLAYSLTSWASSFEELISQISLKYNFAKIHNNPVSLYAEFIRNHNVKAHANGACIGLEIGKIKKAKDICFNINYQYIGAYALPAFENLGIQKAIHIKGIYALTENFAIHGKISTGNGLKTETTAVYTF